MKKEKTDPAQPALSRPALRLLTINVWSGLDYKGSLRFIMNTFVVRFDVGFGKEYTGVYFNFGHLF